MSFPIVFESGVLIARDYAITKSALQPYANETIDAVVLILENAYDSDDLVPFCRFFIGRPLRKLTILIDLQSPAELDFCKSLTIDYIEIKSPNNTPISLLHFSEGPTGLKSLKVNTPVYKLPVTFSAGLDLHLTEGVTDKSPIRIPPKEKIDDIGGVYQIGGRISMVKSTGQGRISMAESTGPVHIHAGVVNYSD